MLHIFLINPYAGKQNFSSGIREELKGIPEIEYFVFNILYKNHEYELVKQILTYLEGNEMRLYVCGGMGTLHRVLNALYDMAKLSEVEVAWLALGTSNCFVNSLEGDTRKMGDLKELINGYVAPCDYIKTDHAIAINSMSFGFDSTFIKIKNNISSMGIGSSKIVSALARLYALCVVKPVQLTVRFDDKEVIDSFDEVFFGNGSYIADELKIVDDAKQNDGIGNYSLSHASNSKISARLKYMRAVKKQDMDYLKKHLDMECTSKLEVISDSILSVNLDGELYSTYNKWKAEMIHEGIKLVLPKGVTFHE